MTPITFSSENHNRFLICRIWPNIFVGCICLIGGLFQFSIMRAQKNSGHKSTVDIRTVGTGKQWTVNTEGQRAQMNKGYK